MDTYTIIVELIQNLGFPIACCIALFYRNSKLEESHKADLKALETSIDNNTTMMNNVLTELQVIKEGLRNGKGQG